MEYVTDDQGQIMVRDAKGNAKYFHKNMVNNRMLMERMGFTPVPKPEIMAPITQQIATSPIPIEINKPVESIYEDKAKAIEAGSVVEVINAPINAGETIAPKRRGRPPLIK